MTEASVHAEGDVQQSRISDVIRASAEHDLKVLEKYIDEYSFPECKVVDVQDVATGYTPLHAAIASCRPTDSGHEPESSAKLDAAAATLRFMLENGAIWNQLDKNDETPGCIAYRLSLSDLYQIMVDAGVRAEMILNRLEEYDRMEDEDEDENENETQNDSENKGGTNGESAHQEPASTAQPEVNGSAYLSSALSLSGDKLLDEQQNGVMMVWESGIMQKSADALLYDPGLRILNIGFGMGIIDSHIQTHSKRPAGHHIVEAHPDVLEKMKKDGWMDKAGVVVHSGKWQEVLPRLAAEGEMFDAIYFDTFAESYSEFRQFFSEQVLSLLEESGRWSFFNGMGADRQISYDVYQTVVEMDLFEAGFNVEWKDVELPKLDQEWDGVRRKYWDVDHYRLPVCRFMD
ncbi:arginine N-methyltransferase [Exophiala viscosa]|uniref:arginine N-methyltransferase n=1 Tax=Exophiala viscosa TaxID=2486360 RepID=UPI00218CA41D|nr:arginine N-methyltransferase [Exophiala viscosa]